MSASTAISQSKSELETKIKKLGDELRQRTAKDRELRRMAFRFSKSTELGEALMLVDNLKSIRELQNRDGMSVLLMTYGAAVDAVQLSEDIRRAEIRVRHLILDRETERQQWFQKEMSSYLKDAGFICSFEDVEASISTLVDEWNAKHQDHCTYCDGPLIMDPYGTINFHLTPGMDPNGNHQPLACIPFLNARIEREYAAARQRS